jgi:hypothetical protein
MADTDDTLQANSQSSQNSDPDIKKMFKHFVTGGHTPDDNEPGLNIGIDDIRAQISITITGSKTADLIKALNIDPAANTIAGTPNTTTPVQLSQESRCHAFYRVIGFPVINSDQSDFYNPGFDIVMGEDIERSITLERKLRIATNIGTKFEDLSQKREEYASQCAQIFSVPQSVEAGVLSLTSGTYGKGSNVNRRPFAQPFKNTEPFDFKVENQSYSVPGNIASTYTLTGDREVRLADFQDINADPSKQFKPNQAGYNILSQHQHIIKPFMVDPRIDFSIWAAESKTSTGVSKRIAIPFVYDASYLKTSSTARAERPLLEKVIRDRLSTPTVNDAGADVKNTIDYIKGNKALQSITIGTTTIGNIFSGSVFNLSQQQAFAQYLSTMRSMIYKLVDSMRIVHARQGFYYWLPIPDTTGPEGGCSIRSVPLSKNIDPALFTPFDFDIIAKQASVVMSNLNGSIIEPTATPDPGNFAFSNYKLTFDASTSDAQGNLSAKSQENLTGIRNKMLEEAGDALQIIEMIMGEFSGLGLADIVAIMGALYVMPLNDPASKGTGNLLGFLDEDAVIRAEEILVLPDGTLQNVRSGITPAMTSLCNTVNSFYQIMDQIFQDYMNNNALNLANSG